MMNKTGILMLLAGGFYLPAVNAMLIGKSYRSPVYIDRPVPGVSRDGKLVDKLTLKKWGYRKNQLKYYDPRICTPKRLRPRKIVIQNIRSIAGISGNSKKICGWCRFSIVQETYRNRIYAQARFRSMVEKRHVRRNSRIAKECGLRGFFHLRNKVYILHTDVMIQMPDLKKLLPRVERYFLRRELQRCKPGHPQRIPPWQCAGLKRHLSKPVQP